MTLDQLNNRVERLKGERDRIAREIEGVRKALVDLDDQRVHLEEARHVIQTVATLTQQELEYHVSELGTLALSAVFPDPYSLKLNFEIKRGQSEAKLCFARGESVLEDPMAESGGGPVDVAAFALRLSLWSLAKPRSANLIVLDEPFRFLSVDLQPKASQMLKEISTRLGLQFLIVTHSPALTEMADRVFDVRMVEDRSVVTVQK